MNCVILVQVLSIDKHKLHQSLQMTYAYHIEQFQCVWFYVTLKKIANIQIWIFCHSNNHKQYTVLNTDYICIVWMMKTSKWLYFFSIKHDVIHCKAGWKEASYLLFKQDGNDVQHTSGNDITYTDNTRHGYCVKPWHLMVISLHGREKAKPYCEVIKILFQLKSSFKL